MRIKYLNVETKMAEPIYFWQGRTRDFGYLGVNIKTTNKMQQVRTIAIDDL